jgi:electron transfer flavoprotein beta subunit
MKVVVFCKSVPDSETRIRLKDGKLDKSDIKYLLNPYDEYGVEEAVRMKEAGKVEEIVAISMGPDRAREALRSALAMGADRAVLIKDDALDDSDTYVTAKVLVKALEKDGVDYGLLLFGQQAIDGDTWHVPGQVAEMLRLPQAGSIVKLEIDPDKGKAIANRMVEGGEEVHEMSLPCVVTCRKGLNEPRYPSLPNIMKAKKKPIQDYSISDLGLSPEEVGRTGSLTEVLSYSLPPQKEAGKKLEGEPEEVTQALVQYLKEELKVI